ncbi:MAG TPA: hypothetical protein VMT62_09910 [Syntrophorhabdaceae bacterium]|nr:hypothetical protein [Syntrophorhabdaceae bacterium]
MMFYVTLISATCIIVALMLLIWLRTRNVAFPLGIAFLYYWSLYGAWSIIADKTGGESGMHYQYLEEKLFAVNLDNDYLLTLVLYSLFIIIVELIVLFLYKKCKTPKRTPSLLGTVNHRTVLIIGSIAGTVSFLIVSSAIVYSFRSGMSAYVITRIPGEVGNLFTLHQVLNRVALFSGAIGVAIFLSSQDAMFFTSRRSRLILFLYVLLLASMYSFCLVLGNKNELFASFVLFLLVYLTNSNHPKRNSYVVFSILVLFAIGVVDLVRGLPLDNLSGIRIGDLRDAVRAIGSSNEAFGAHFSLYGALHYDIPITYGSSIISLATSIVPRIFWPNRPADIYFYYADRIGAVEGQGYAIHHATAWYLNFGYVGIAMGAALFGWLWVKLYNSYNLLDRRKQKLANVVIFIAPIAFTSNIPNLIRAGMEAYKGVLVDAFLTPSLILFCSLFRINLFRK